MTFRCIGGVDIDTVIWNKHVYHNCVWKCCGNLLAFSSTC